MFGKKKKQADGSPQPPKGDKKKSRSSVANKPMMLAAIAALLAVIGAALAIWTTLGRSQTVVDEIVASNEPTTQVLVVADVIPATTSVDQILETPTSYLTVKQYPEGSVADNVFFEFDELEEYRGLTASVDLMPGEQLLKDRFTDPSSFTQETYIERASAVKLPEGHHSFVLSLPADRALGGNVRAGDKVAVLGSFTFSTEEDSTQVSVVALPEIEVVQVQATDAGAGQLGAQLDDVGLASLANYSLTVAVTPAEMADLTYVVEYGQVRLAGALDGSSPEDDRAFSTLATLMGGAVNPRTETTFDIGEGSKSGAEFNVGKGKEEAEAEGDSEGTEGAEGTEGNTEDAEAQTGESTEGDSGAEGEGEDK